MDIIQLYPDADGLGNGMALNWRYSKFTILQICIRKGKTMPFITVFNNPKSAFQMN
jgi:hypothetical protein